MSGLFVNAYDIAFHSDVTLWRFPRPDGADKHDAELAAGVSLWTDADTFWCTRKPVGASQARSVSLPTADPGGLMLFAARDALVEHAHQAGRDAWFGRGGEMHFMGLLASQTADRFVLEPELVVRLVQEEFVDADALAVVRARTRWRSHEPLASPEVAARAVGERAVRLSGEGPRRARVEAVDGDELELRVGPTVETVAAADYALIVGSRLAVAWRGSEALRDLNIASGVLTVSNKRNRYAVKDRFVTAGRMLRALEWPVPLPTDATLTLGKPVAIRQQGSA
ncbi:MAG: hypothetical protein ACLP0J_15170 [Solirubrobacteraceae bacterium]